MNFTQYATWVCFVCYIYLLCRSDSATVPELYLHLYWYIYALYTVLCIDMFVYVVNYTNCLYLTLGACSISFLWMDYSTTMSSWHLRLYQYVCENYIYGLLQYVCVLHIIYYLVVIHIGKRVLYISWFIIPLLKSLLTCIHNSG